MATATGFAVGNGGVQEYQEDGFYISVGSVFPEDVIVRASEGMDRIRAGDYDTGLSPRRSRWNPGDSEDTLCKIEMPQIANGAVRDLVSHPALGQFAARITGAKRVQVWWVQLLCKPSQKTGQLSGANIGWHQDRQYWANWEEGSELFTVWVAISDVTAESGPMRFVRGSHLWGFRGEGDFTGQDLDQQKHQEISRPQGQSWEEIAVILPPGGASLHHHLVYHGSGPNLSGTLRRSFAIHMRSENSRPVDDRRAGLTEYIDNFDFCPVLYGDP